MKLSKRIHWITAACVLIVACVIALALVWSPFAKPTLEQSTVVLAPAPGVSPPAGRDDVLAIVYSGDGGWSDLDKQIGTVFAAHGIPVLGVNTFKYFWRWRSPDTAAAQLDALMNRGLAKWHKRRVWLVGFSFGADVLPTLIDKLSPANRARITQLVLLSPSRDISFEIQLEGYMVTPGRFKTFAKKLSEKFNKVPQYPALPPVAALRNRFPVACYYGSDDAGDTLCTEPGLPRWVDVHGRQGGHHLGHNYHTLGTEMIQSLPVARNMGAAARVNLRERPPAAQ